MSLFTITFGLLLSGTAFADTDTSTKTETQTATSTETASSTNTATDAAPSTSPEEGSATKAETSTETTTTTSTETATGTETTTGTNTTTDTASTTTTETAKTVEPAPSVSMKPQETKKSSDAHADHEEGGHVAGQFTIEAMWEASSTPVRIVLLTLLFMMIACIFVGIERLMALRTSNKESDELREKIETLFQNGTFQNVNLVEQLAQLKKSTEEEEPSYLKSIMSAGIAEFSARQDTYGIEAVERALEKVIAVETKALGKGMNILATTGATASTRAAPAPLARPGRAPARKPALRPRTNREGRAGTLCGFWACCCTT